MQWRVGQRCLADSGASKSRCSYRMRMQTLHCKGGSRVSKMTHGPIAPLGIECIHWPNFFELQNLDTKRFVDRESVHNKRRTLCTPYPMSSTTSTELMHRPGYLQRAYTLHNAACYRRPVIRHSLKRASDFRKQETPRRRSLLDFRWSMIIASAIQKRSALNPKSLFSKF